MAVGLACCQPSPTDCASADANLPLARPSLPCSPAGTFRDADGGDGTECAKCAPGSWSASGAGACTDCPVGFFAPNEGTPDKAGAQGCTACPAGSATNVTGSQECNTCEPGTYQPATGQATCIDAGAGYFTIATGDNGAIDKTACPKGTYKAADAKDNKCQRWVGRQCWWEWSAASRLPACAAPPACRRALL